MGGPTGVCGGQCPPTFGTSGVQGVRGAVAVQWKWYFLLLQQTVFIQYCTSDWISTPLTLVDTCQVRSNDIWKDGLGRQISIYSTGPYWYLLACIPTFRKVGVQIFFGIPLTLKSAAPPLFTMREQVPVCLSLCVRTVYAQYIIVS